MTRAIEVLVLRCDRQSQIGCTQLYHRHADQIDPFPKNLDETLPVLESLCQYIIDPVIDGFGRARFLLTYGFYSVDLKRWLAKKDPLTGKKHGIATPSLDQHMAHGVNRNGRYYCDRLGAACNFRILDLPSDALWIGSLPRDCPLTRCISMAQTALSTSAMAPAQAQYLGFYRTENTDAVPS
ncbi:hypothetical protein NC974_18830 [Leptolyngbya sp. SLC-A1]|nr:hypothetical protein [Leptolyngbya sp. FACHB-60]